MKISNRSLKERARAALTGNYKVLIGAILLGDVITLVLGELFYQNADNRMALLISSLSSVIITLLAFVLEAGYHFMFLQIARNQKTKLTDMFKAFFVHPDKVLKIALMLMAINLALMIPFLLISAWIVKRAGYQPLPVLYQLMMLRQLPPPNQTMRFGLLCFFLLWLVSMLAVNLRYVLVLFCYADWPEATSTTLMKESRDLMEGNRLRYLALVCSFLGIALLGVLSFGIGFLWITPYFHLTGAFFYLHLDAPQPEEEAPSCQ